MEFLCRDGLETSGLTRMMRFLGGCTGLQPGCHGGDPSSHNLLLARCTRGCYAIHVIHV